jgi:hypothetical protein
MFPTFMGPVVISVLYWSCLLVSRFISTIIQNSCGVIFSSMYRYIKQHNSDIEYNYSNYSTQHHKLDLQHKSSSSNMIHIIHNQINKHHKDKVHMVYLSANIANIKWCVSAQMLATIVSIHKHSTNLSFLCATFGCFFLYSSVGLVSICSILRITHGSCIAIHAFATTQSIGQLISFHQNWQLHYYLAKASHSL